MLLNQMSDVAHLVQSIRMQNKRFSCAGVSLKSRPQ